MRLRSVFIGPIFFFLGREEVKSFYTSLFFNVEFDFPQNISATQGISLRIV